MLKKLYQKDGIIVIIEDGNIELSYYIMDNFQKDKYEIIQSVLNVNLLLSLNALLNTTHSMVIRFAKK